MAESSMFSDRRASQDRRKQQLSMPAGLNRRKGCRRDRNFHSKPWWLKVDYSDELVSEKECGEHIEAIPAEPQTSEQVDPKPGNIHK